MRALAHAEAIGALGQGWARDIGLADTNPLAQLPLLELRKADPDQTPFKALVPHYLIAKAQAYSLQGTKGKRAFCSLCGFLNNHIMPFWGDVMIGDIDRRKQEQFWRSKVELDDDGDPLAAASIAKLATVMAAVINFSCDQRKGGLLIREPGRGIITTDEVEIQRASNAAAPILRRALGIEELAALLNAMDCEHAYWFVWGNILTMARPGALKKLRWDDGAKGWDSLGMVDLCPANEVPPKNKYYPCVPVGGVLGKLLAAIPRRGPFVFPKADGSMMSEGALRKPIRSAAIRAGLMTESSPREETIFPFSIRISMAEILLEDVLAGHVPGEQLSMMMGHTRLTEEQARNAMAMAPTTVRSYAQGRRKGKRVVEALRMGAMPEALDRVAISIARHMAKPPGFPMISAA